MCSNYTSAGQAAVILEKSVNISWGSPVPLTYLKMIYNTHNSEMNSR